jgi:hypothetical protein
MHAPQAEGHFSAHRAKVRLIPTDTAFDQSGAQKWAQSIPPTSRETTFQAGMAPSQRRGAIAYAPADQGQKDPALGETSGVKAAGVAVLPDLTALTH